MPPRRPCAPHVWATLEGDRSGELGLTVEERVDRMPYPQPDRAPAVQCRAPLLRSPSGPASSHASDSLRTSSSVAFYASSTASTMSWASENFFWRSESKKPQNDLSFQDQQSKQLNNKLTTGHFVFPREFWFHPHKASVHRPKVRLGTPSPRARPLRLTLEPRPLAMEVLHFILCLITTSTKAYHLALEVVDPRSKAEELILPSFRAGNLRPHPLHLAPCGL